jgi:hypothetical protein
MTMRLDVVQPDSFLRRVWWADAAISAVVGAAMAAAAAPLASLTGLPERLLAAAGLALLPYAAFLAWLATRQSVPRLAAWLPVPINILWAIDCVLVAATEPNAGPALIAFIAVQVVTVLAFAELEFVGVRRLARRTA